METQKQQQEENKVIKKKLTPEEIELLSKLIGKDRIVKMESARTPPDNKEKKPTPKN